jgi:BirA family transcriptional regulator, biotin operon repressor / biotin---[acetyl-CoA-carboxylase] ligase
MEQKASRSVKGQEGSVAVLPDDPIDPATLKASLGNSLFSTHILHLESIDSTNRLLRELALKGGPEGTLVLAEEQTAGRGRRGRIWTSPAGSNLLFSILLRPSMDPEKVFTLTMALALAIVHALRRVTGLSALIKWPNDLYVRGNKLAGILTEFGMKDKILDYVVLGMGMNVNWHPPGEQGIRHSATSLLAETGRRFSRNELLLEILRDLEGSYERVLKGEIEALYGQWNELSLILGRQVTIESDTEVIEGKAQRIDEQGALILEEAGGSERRVLCGDVSLSTFNP